mgnify:CR=1 FL=1
MTHTIDCVSIVMLNHGLNHSLTFQAFLMKIHSKLIKFRINIKTKLLQILSVDVRKSYLMNSSFDLIQILAMNEGGRHISMVLTLIQSNQHKSLHGLYLINQIHFCMFPV